MKKEILGIDKKEFYLLLIFLVIGVLLTAIFGILKGLNLIYEIVSDIFLSIGTGIISSVILSFFIDRMNYQERKVKIKKQREDFIFEILNFELQMAIKMIDIGIVEIPNKKKLENKDIYFCLKEIKEAAISNFFNQEKGNVSLVNELKSSLNACKSMFDSCYLPINSSSTQLLLSEVLSSHEIKILQMTAFELLNISERYFNFCELFEMLSSTVISCAQNIPEIDNEFKRKIHFSKNGLVDYKCGIPSI